MSNSLRQKKGGSTLVWGLMALVMVGLGGFGVRNFGGGIGAIGTVGTQEISTGDYARALRSEREAFSRQIGQPVTAEMVRTFGLDKQVQARLFADATFDHEAARVGVSVGDDEVRRRIYAIKAFQGLDGTFSRDAYRLVLQQNGLTESDFEDQTRAEAARGLVQAAVAGGVAVPAAMVQTLNAWTNQSRDFRIAVLNAHDLPAPVAAPDEAQIKAYYEAHPEAFTTPETRRITYLLLTPEMMLPKVPVDEQALREAYQARHDDFVSTESRLVERLVYPTEDEASAAKARLDAGQATMESLAAERGLTLADIDLGEQSRAQLGPAGDAVFALAEPGVVGPLPSDLGPALYAMNGIIAAKEVSFEEAREELSQAVVADRARRIISDSVDKLSDLLASGASLEDVAKESDMQLGTVAFNSESEGGILGYQGFREAAAKATEQDFPEIMDLDDGGIFALRLDGIDAPALKPLDQVRDAVIAAWTRDETQKRLTELAQEVQAQLSAGAALETLGFVTTAYEGFGRDGFVEGVPPTVIETLFGLPDKGSAAIPGDGAIYVVALSRVNEADPADPDMVQGAARIEARLAQGLSNDALDLFTRALQAETQVTVNPAAIEAVQAQMN